MRHAQRQTDAGQYSADLCFSDRYRNIVRPACSVAERLELAQGVAVTEVREKIVRCLWFDQFLDHGNLHTADGRSLSVFFPGHWNEGAGPDFLNAEFALGNGERMRGDIEVHVLASGWYRHGHAEDPAYGKVGLHVVLSNDLDSLVVECRDTQIPQFVLEHQLSNDLQEILKSLDPDGYPRIGCGREGICGRSIRAFARDDRWVGWFLDIAGDERIVAKSERLGALARDATADDAFYGALMDAMGYSSNRHGFRILASRAPLCDLRRFVPFDSSDADRLRHVEAILFGVAGFLDRAGAEHNDLETQAIVESLQEVWASARRVFGVPLPADVWNLKHTRPTNHPVRRIAGVSVFLARHLHDGLCRAVMAAVERPSRRLSADKLCRATLRELTALLRATPGPYWLQRTCFGPPCLGRPAQLIGEERATNVVVNVVMPLLLFLARTQELADVEHRLHNLYTWLRPRSENRITRYMAMRIFGGDEKHAATVVRSLRRQQGLLQVFHDFCEDDRATCDACGFLAAVEDRSL